MAAGFARAAACTAAGMRPAMRGQTRPSTAGPVGPGVMLGGGWVVATFRPQWGVYGPWGASAVAFILLGLAYLVRFRLGGWEKIDLHRH